MRKTYYRWLFVALAVIAVAAVSVAVMNGMRARDRRDSALADYEKALQLVESAEPVLGELDALMEADITPDRAAEASSVADSLTDAEAGLRYAARLLERARPELDEARAASARAIVDSADARVRMIEAGRRAIGWDVKAARAVGPAREGWRLVLDAEKLADEAVASYNRHTKESVRDSSAKAGQAKEKLALAGVRFKAAADAFPGADMTPYLRYCADKAALLDTSLRIDSLWLAGKVAEANKQLAEYNRKESALVESAKRLPSSETAPIAAAYDAKAGEDSEAYYEARKAASSSDAEVKRLSKTVD